MQLSGRTAALILAAVSIALACVSGCGKRETEARDKMQVAASIAPLADFARNVGGDLVQVELLVPPGSSPHVYQLSPSQMKLLSNASVLVLNGVGLEFWADKAVDAAANPKLIVIETAHGLPIIGSSCDHHDHHGGHESGNPHVWLNPAYAMRQVESIRDAFIKADPAHARQYRANSAAYIDKLKALDKDIRARVETFSSKKFIAYHAAWVYFAGEYGLDQAAVVEASPGREASPREIRHVVDTARRINAKAIFAEPQFSPKAARVIAEESGAQVLFLNPLGEPPTYDYIATMRMNVDQIAKALE